ncbi:MAG: DUF2232 domain-containing protein [Eubacteriales bacterium]|nr:DUF2232 domain-containing protein [Eubacteriales bacterium]MDY3332308.1 DUF2232 domain-containing protein [Gallibacter sp.]
MTLEIILLITIIFPITFMSAIRKCNRPFYVIGLSAIISAGLVLLYIAYLTVTKEMSLTAILTEEMEKVLGTIKDNPNLHKLLPFGLSINDENLLKNMAELVGLTMPSFVFMVSSIIGYIAYSVAARIKNKDGAINLVKARIANFSLQNKDVTGLFLIYIGAYLIKFAGFGIENAVLINVRIIVESIIAFQGVAYIFTVTAMKKIPSALVGVLVVIVWMTGYGQTFLFFIGLFDLFFNVRKRQIRY